MKFTNVQALNDFKLGLENIFDYVRVVDSVAKEVIGCDGNEFSCHSTCYDNWRSGNYCLNCISSRAVNEDETFVKIEYDKDQVYIVMASSVEVEDKKFAIEMLKHTTETGITQDLEGKSIEEINNIILKLNEDLVTDALTNVFNRRYINERLPVDIYDAFKNNKDLSVIMLDLDFFKMINDQYGHDAGDVILKEISKILKSKIRKNCDWIARYGGEEFLISLPGADNKVAYRIAEDIRKEIEKHEIDYDGQKLKVTISAGVYTLETEKIGYEEVIKIADKKMYEAKNKGRNIVV